MTRTLSSILFLAVFSVLSLPLVGQTLYWVGGSGNFNDPKHWSYQSGGVPAFVIPGSNNEVVFDDNSGVGYYSVSFDQNNIMRSLTARSYQNMVSFSGSRNAVLYINGGINLGQFAKFNSSAEIIFNNESQSPALVEFGLNELSCNLYFNKGTYNIRSLHLSEKNSILFSNGTYNINRAVIVAGNISSSGPQGIFNVKESFIKSTGNFKFNLQNQFSSNKLHLVANINSPEKFQVPTSLKTELTNTLVNYMAPICSLTITTIPSCQGPCSGVLTISFSPGCTDPPYNVFVNNPDPTCAPTAATLSANNVTSVSSVYSASNACECPLQNYQVLVFDNSLNFVSQNVNFIPNPAFLTNVNTSPLCPNSCTGSMTGNIFGNPPFSVTVTPSGTITPSTFTTALSYTITNMCAGTYTFKIVDVNGCTTTHTRNLSGPAPILPNAITASLACNSICNGSFAVSPTGGTPGYTVVFNPGATTITIPGAGTASITGLCAGNYTANITDANGCPSVATASITQPASLTAVQSQTNLTCFTNCTGAASIALSGGTSPYSYTWSPGPGSSAGISGLCAGTQTVSVLDANGCALTRTYNITSPPAITLNVSSTNVVCNGGCNGSATVTASGGVAPISFTWTGPPPFTTSTSSVISGLCPGVYTLNALDAGGCAAQATVNITQPPPLTLTVNGTNNTCFSVCAGSATAGISGGNGAPFNFTWTPGGPPLSGQGTATVSNLCANNYTVAVTDASNCPISATLSITQPSSITPNITSASVTCNGACTGSINANPTGGNGGPYTFTLITPSSGTIIASPPYTSLCAGVYTLLINDALNCLTTRTVNIQQPNPLVLSISSVSITCFNLCNGSLAGNINGGTPPYTAFWTTPSGTVAGTNLTGQCAGNYTFHVTDANNCSATLTTSLQQPADITATFSVTNLSCNTGPCNGAISTTINGGTPGYTLNWSSGPGGNPNQPLCAGTYTLLVQDAQACLKTFTAQVIAPPAVTVAVGTSSTTCAGSCDGSATVTATGGTGTFTYQVNTIPVTTNTTGIVTGLCAGVYIATATDANGCSQAMTFTISSPPLLSAAITGILPTCNVCTGASTVTVSGGVPTYSINWINTASVVVATGSVATGLCLGTYTAQVTDSQGCTTSATVNIVNTVSVTVVTAGSGILCHGACTASATANAIGGTPPYNYSWNTIPTQTTQSATNLCAGSYTVVVTDQLGCSNTGSISFTQPPALTVTTTQTNNPCFGNCIGAISATATGGTGSISYSWSPGGQTTTSITSLCSGTYALLVTDINSCTLSTSFSVTENPSITAVFSATNPSGCFLNNGTICASASGGSGSGYTFTWSPAGSGGPNNPCNTNLGAGTYSLVIMDGAGCTTTLSASLSNPTGPTVSVTSFSAPCFGTSTGSAIATASGTGPFTFTWTPATTSLVSGATTTATGMSSGNYNISVTDANGCITTQTLNIAQPPATTVTQNVSSLACFSVCNGSITVLPSGGTPGYTFTWSPGPITGQGTGTVTNLCAGQYTVNISDANSCITTRTFNVTQPSSLNIVSSFTNVQCNGSANGVISVTLSGGTPAYGYTWTPALPNSSLVTGLSPGTYTLNAGDANGCPISTVITITQPSSINLSVLVTNAVCNSLCNGTASQVVSGGTPGYSFSWSFGPATTQSVNSLCAGNYTANVTDANGCVSSIGFTVTQPSAISITATPTNPLCNASCNGSITTNVSGGNGGYSYTWLPTGFGSNPTGLCAGTYTLSILDASLCPGTAVVTLTNPPAPLANVSFTNPSCNAFCNGVAFSNPTNVTAPVGFTWSPTSPLQTAPTATGLCDGGYTVTVQDANGCSATQAFTITSPPSLTVATSMAAATCGSSNGSINVTPSGGTPAYTFSWLPSVLGTNSFVTGVPAGIYTVTVTDANNCSNTLQIPLSNSDGPNAATITVSHVTCNSFSNGSATVTNVSGGTPGYTISWVSPPAPATVNPATNLSAGTYTAQVMDSNNCLYFQSVTINQPPAFNANANVSNALCVGICSGSVTLNPNGGTPGYSYTWSPGSPTGQGTGTVTNLCVGIYSVTVMDTQNCVYTSTFNVGGVITLTSAISSNSNICFGNCNGSATVTSSSGGTPPYSYVWSNLQTGPVSSNLCNGVYSVTVTDLNGCQNTFTTPIVSPPAIALTPAISSPSCGLCNGSASVTASGGTAPYTYSWSTSATGTVVSNLCAGLNQVLVTDNNGCSDIVNILVSNSQGITGETFQVQDETCFNQCNGSVTVTPIGGNPPITFNWISPVSTNSVLTGLCGGNYIVQMQDAQGCIRTSSVDINSAIAMTITPVVTPPACGSTNGSVVANVTGGSGIYTYTWLPLGTGSASLTNIGPGTYTLLVNDGACTQTTEINISNFNSPIILASQLNPRCNGDCNGQVAITPTLGTPGYTVNWSNSQTSNTVTGLCSGVITVTVTDAAGCVAAQSFTLTQPDAIGFSFPIVGQISCHNDCDGSIALVPNGGTLPYVISWIPTTTVSPTNPLTNLCAGSYTGIVTDANNCAVTSTFNLVNPPDLDFDFDITNATCSTINDGAITTTVSGGNPAYSYTWTGASGTFSVPDLTGLSTGVYTLTTVDSKGCRKDTTVTIVPGFTVIADAGRDTSFCFLNQLTLNGINSINAVNYTWEAVPGNTIATTVTTQINPLPGTNTFVLLVTSSVTGCYDLDTVLVTVHNLPDVDAGPNYSISLFTSTQIGGSPTTVSGLTYTWLPSGTLDNPNVQNPIASNTVNTTYTVFVTDANGCVWSDTMYVHIYPEIKIPNGFSPNNDGRNDAWVIDNLEQFPNNRVEVYNRWGELLFTQSPYQNKWDGKFKGKDLPVGTYYYIINLNHEAYPKPYTGPLTIFR